MIPRAETTDMDHLTDPASHAPRECDKCRADCDHPRDVRTWEDVQLCAWCAENAVEGDDE